MVLATEITRTCGACSSPWRASSGSICAGESLPSGVGSVSSLTPAMRSGAAASSMCRCDVSGVTTHSHVRVSAPSDRTLAAVPLKTIHGWACAPNCALISSLARAVHGSAP